MKRIVLSVLMLAILCMGVCAEDYIVNYTYNTDSEIALGAWSGPEYAASVAGDNIYIENGRLNFEMISQSEYNTSEPTYYQMKVMGGDNFELDGSSANGYITGGIVIAEIDMRIDATATSFKSDQIFTLFSSLKNFENIFAMSYDNLTLRCGEASFAVTSGEDIHMKFIFDLDSFTADWYVNDALTGEDIPFVKERNGFDRIMLGRLYSNTDGCINDGGTLSIDNVLVYRPNRSISITDYSENISKADESASNDVAEGESIEISFSEALADSIAECIEIRDKNGEPHTMAEISFKDGGNSTVRIVPSGLKSGEKYSIIVYDTITDAAGNNQLVETEEFIFYSAKVRNDFLILAGSGDNISVTNSSSEELQCIIVQNICIGTADSYTIDGSFFIPVFINPAETVTVPIGSGGDFVKVMALDTLPGLLMAAEIIVE